MSQSRSKNVFKNASISLLCQILNLFISFSLRTVFIHTLGVEYLGVNGLFSNILMVLSFAELGIGSAITYSLYKPLAIEDKPKIASLMQLYKKAYTILGLVVIGAGIIVIPFLNLIIINPPNISENIKTLYFLYLLDTGISYFLVYKKSILIADQKYYIVLLIDHIVNILHFIVNIYILYVTRNFILYLLLNIIFTIVSNLIVGVVANRRYPYLKVKAKPLDRGEQKQIFRDVKSLAVYKFGSVIVNGTDNILISSLIGVAQVGFVSNYTLILNACNTILGKIEEAFMASVGNLNAVSDSEKKYNVFQKMLLITFWIYGFAACGLALLINPFITLWIGGEYCLSLSVVIAVCLEFYISGMQNPAYIYRTTHGLFKQGQFSAVLASVLNITLSIGLYHLIGLSGIFFATSIAKFFSYGIVDPVLIYKNAFDKNVFKYFKTYFTYLFILIGIYLGLFYLLSCISIEGILGFVLKFILVCLGYNTIMLFLFSKTNVFRDLLHQVLQTIRGFLR